VSSPFDNAPSPASYPPPAFNTRYSVPNVVPLGNNVEFATEPDSNTDCPDVPLVPDVPDVPLIPDVPLHPDLPLTPVVPEIPLVPEVPLIPVVPE
jgi:hypothetical protein